MRAVSLPAHCTLPPETLGHQRSGPRVHPGSTLPYLIPTASSHYWCMAQDSLNGDQLTAQFEVDLEIPNAESMCRKSKSFEDINQDFSVSS